MAPRTARPKAQRRYEQASTLAPTAAERADHLRLAAGAAATRYVGNDAVRLLRAAADTATEIGDRGGAALDLAWMSIYIDRFPGIMADKPTPDEAAGLTDEAQAISDGSARPQAAIALSWTMLSDTAAQPYDERNGDRPSSNRRGTPSISPTGLATPPSRAPPSTG